MDCKIILLEITIIEVGSDLWRSPALTCSKQPASPAHFLPACCPPLRFVSHQFGYKDAIGRLVLSGGRAVAEDWFVNRCLLFPDTFKLLPGFLIALSGS